MTSKFSPARSVALTLAAAAALSVFGSQSALALPAPAGPADPAEIWPMQVEAVNAAPLPCVSGGPVQADADAAAALNPLLANKMRGFMNSYNASCARAVVTAVKARGLNERAAAIAVATTIVETSIANLNLGDGDLDSVGLFQQRTSWGTVAQRLDPSYATNKFLNEMEGFYPNGSWNTAAIGDVAADVQRPATQYRYRYGVEANDAITIAHFLWSPSGSTNGKADLVRINTDGSLTAWQNNDALSGGWSAPSTIGNGGTSDATRLKFADLNADGKADLVRINTDGSLTAWQNNNALSGGWSAPSTIGNGGTSDTTRLKFADLNADGKADLVRINTDGSLTAWQNNNALSGGWSTPSTIGNGGTSDATRLEFADLNADGKADLVRINTDGSLTAWQNNNALSGGWSTPSTIGNGGTSDATRLEFADLNADGKADLVRINTDGSLTAWQNNNALSGGWSTPSTIGNGGTSDATRLKFAELG